MTADRRGRVQAGDDPYETSYKTGQDNVQILGMDLHNPVFFISALSILAFAIGTLSFPDEAQTILLGARDWTLDNADWFFVIATNLIFLFCALIALSPFGAIRLGGANARPDFSVKSWLAMLFSAGVGIGLMFYGAAEPLAYYTNWFGTPLNATPLTDEAEALAYSATIFHWGVTPWAIYAIMGLALAFFSFNKGLPLTIRSTFYPLLGERVWSWPGHGIDLLAVVATLFGLATSLGLGARQAAAGLEFLFGIDGGLGTQIVFICGITALAIVSVVRGLDGGVKVLSNLNIALAVLFLTFVIVSGPTQAIVKQIIPNASAYVTDTFRLSNWIGREDTEWFHGWTIFYWAWWVSWSPFVGMFIARISRGRTIRQFVAAVLIVPLGVTILWFTAFGVTAIEQAKSGVEPLSSGISDVSLVLFQMLAHLPFGEFASLIAVVLLVIFFVTSSDSGSLVIDSITAGGKLHAPVGQRIFWASMEGLVAIVLLVGGGSAALNALQAGAITAGLPFTLVLLVCCVSLFRGLSQEKVQATTTRAPANG
ncbi:MAG: BCCT family transporter [Pseudomonadota bacterium]